MARRPTLSPTAEDREKSRRVGALAELWPYLRPYRLLLGAAFLALVLTASVSLMLPLAVRRVVDGFETSAEALLDHRLRRRENRNSSAKKLA